MDQEKAKRKQLRELRIGLRALRGALDTAGRTIRSMAEPTPGTPQPAWNT